MDYWINHTQCRTTLTAACLLLAIVAMPIGAIAQARAQSSAILQKAAGLAAPQQTLDRERPIFIENRGQWDEEAKFLLRSPGLDLWITDNGVVYDINRIERVETTPQQKWAQLLGIPHAESPSRVLPQLRVTRAPVFITYEGASTNASAVGEGKLQQFHNYYIGNDRSKWASGVPLYSDARVRGLYKGIDAVFYLDNGRPRYDLVVAPGADPSRVRMKIEGATDVSVAANGSLMIATPLGTVEQRELFAYQERNGAKEQVRCGFRKGSDGMVRFDVGSYDRTKPLVIDPLVWSTYLGGSSDDAGLATAVDPSGNVYVTGYTVSTNFPRLNALQSTFGRGSGYIDAFVTKYTSSGSLSYSTYLGGDDHSDQDQGLGIAVDADGLAYVTGRTGSRDFPTLNAAQGTKAGGSDAFVTKLTSTGSLSYSTFFGGSFGEYAYAIAIDGSGNMYITGFTGSSDLPSAPSMNPHRGYVAKLTSSGSVSFTRYLTGEAHGIAVDGSGNIYMTGPTPNDNSGVAQDVFVVKMSSSGSQTWSMSFGGSNANDVGESIGLDGDGNAYVAGITSSTSFPTTSGSFMSTFPGNNGSTGGNDNAFLTKVTSSGSVSWSTYLGTTSQDYATDIAVDGSGNAYITGATGATSTSFTTSDAVQSTNRGAADAFVARFTSSGSLTYFTFVGGSGSDYGFGIAIDSGGIAYITGQSYSTNYPTSSAAQSSNAGSSDAFITKLLIKSIASASISGSSPYCAGSTVAVSWGSTGVTSVNIDLSTDGGTSWSSVATAQTSGTNGGTYYWTVPNSAGSNNRIRVSDASTSSINASTATFTINTPPSVTDHPDNVTTTAFFSSGVQLSATATGTTPMTMQWEISTNNGSTWNTIFGATSTSHSIPSGDLTTSRSGRSYRIAFTNACSTVYSQPATVTINQATATVSLGNLSHTYNGTAKSATATTSPSGLTVAITYSQGGSPVTSPTNAGNYDVVATINDANYQGSATGTLTIGKATLTVTADDKTKVYGDDNPSLTASYDGFVAGDDESDLSGTLALATDATASSGAGTYDITPSGLTSDNYDITFVDGELEITKAALTVTADDKTKTYGDANPTFTASIDGFVLGEDETDLDGTLDLATSANASSDVGTYAITPSGLTSDNYEITFDDGTLSITQAELVVTADDKTREYGLANPTLTASYSGFLDGDDASVITGAPSLSTTATTASDVDEYPITVGSGTLEADNYTFRFVEGTLDVTTAPLTVTADDADWNCGETITELTGTIDGIRNDDEITVDYSTTATESSPAGEYEIVASASGAALANYTVTYVGGTLTVHRLEITYHPADQAVVSGNSVSFSVSEIDQATMQWQVSTDGGTSWTDISGATSGTLTFTASMSQSGNQYRAAFDNGICSNTTMAATLTVKVYATDLGPAVVFFAVSNNIDNNRDIDVRVELYKNSTLISSGELTREKITGPNQNSSRKYTVPLAMTNGAVDFEATDQLRVKVFARRNGGSGDFPAKLWFNDNPAPNINQGNKGWCRIGNKTLGGTNTGYFYLRSSSALSSSAGSSGESIEQTLGTSWVLYDTWTMYGSSMKTTSSEAVTGAQAIPNPLRGEVATLRLTGVTAGDANVTIYDALGRPILQLPDVSIEHRGEAMLPLDLSSLSSGLYTVRVATADQTITTSITVVR